VLGPTGRNFAAGMSGGVAYVLDERGDFKPNVNVQMVAIEALASPIEINRVKALVQKHLQWTASARAKHVLENWDAAVSKFVKVIPKDYQRMLAAIDKAHARGLSGDAAIMVAFEENARDLARVGGN
jgi:glutamate synthase (ferredoxin)